MGFRVGEGSELRAVLCSTSRVCEFASAWSKRNIVRGKPPLKLIRNGDRIL
jgi:hypothetical protein